MHILEAIKNGLIYHASGENDGIVPQFIVAAALRLPIPVFHSFVELGKIYPEVFENGYILSGSDRKKLLYMQDIKNMMEGKPSTDTYYTDWEQFLEALGVNESF